MRIRSRCGAGVTLQRVPGDDRKRCLRNGRYGIGILSAGIAATTITIRRRFERRIATRGCDDTGIDLLSTDGVSRRESGVFG